MLKQFLGEDYLEGLSRVQFLEANADSIENIGYVRDFTPEEMDAMKDNLADYSIELNDLAIEKKELVKSINEKIKPIDQRRKVILENIRKKSEYVKEDCFVFIDQDSGMVGYYNSNGDLVSSRRIKPDERQTKIFKLPAVKTGTND